MKLPQLLLTTAAGLPLAAMMAITLTIAWPGINPLMTLSLSLLLLPLWSALTLYGCGLAYNHRSLLQLFGCNAAVWGVLLMLGGPRFIL